MNEPDYVQPPDSKSSSLIIVLVLAAVSLAALAFFVQRAREAARAGATPVRTVADFLNTPLAEAPSDFVPQVDELLAKHNRTDVPGCAVGIIHHGELVYSKGFGSANLEYEVPNTPQTLFETASFSKSFTCLCVALLMDEQKILPDDDIRKFVPEMHAFDPPLRIRDLVRCESG